MLCTVLFCLQDKGEKLYKFTKQSFFLQSFALSCFADFLCTFSAQTFTVINLTPSPSLSNTYCEDKGDHLCFYKSVMQSKIFVYH